MPALAPTRPERYLTVADEAVTAMVDPPFDDLQARARAGLLISACAPGPLVTGETPRIEAMAQVLIVSATAVRT
ncbi:hypothetical protein GCM10027445_60400 [Amycolatopsis endophytica]|uniref:Uncharacterized protein n=1 Tax=Amycolatopsis endophytica TaxID=860233 RepID=A0A853AZU6_9PSEU|nr:hypothetical protein [Amycolatopsis endophytica]NYI88172.1 hypothetical protein [Amycolatopsis endophytica]